MKSPRFRALAVFVACAFFVQSCGFWKTVPLQSLDLPADQAGQPTLRLRKGDVRRELKVERVEFPYFIGQLEEPSPPPADWNNPSWAPPSTWRAARVLLDRFADEASFTARWDDHPQVTWQGQRVRRGGCPAAGKRTLYVDSRGDVHACPFCQSPQGSCLEEPLDVITGRLRCMLREC